MIRVRTSIRVKFRARVRIRVMFKVRNRVRVCSATPINQFQYYVKLSPDVRASMMTPYVIHDSLVCLVSAPHSTQESAVGCSLPINVILIFLPA